MKKTIITLDNPIVFKFFAWMHPFIRFVFLKFILPTSDGRLYSRINRLLLKITRLSNRKLLTQGELLVDPDFRLDVKEVSTLDSQKLAKWQEKIRFYKNSTKKKIWVISTRISKIFSDDVASELKNNFLLKDIDVTFVDSFDNVSLRESDLVITLVHIHGEYAGLKKINSVIQAPVIGWYWDNHHNPYSNLKVSQLIDVNLPSHRFASGYIKDFSNGVFGPHMPLCVSQWSTNEADSFFNSFGLAPRSAALWGGFVEYRNFCQFRSDFVEKLRVNGFDEVHFVSTKSPSGFFAKTQEEKFKEWCRYKVSLSLPLAGDLSQRVFDALLSGQVPIVAVDTWDIDSVIPPHIQAELPIVKFDVYDPEVVRQAWLRAVEAFDRGGEAGIRRRHKYALTNHMFCKRIDEIIRWVDSTIA